MQVKQQNEIIIEQQRAEKRTRECKRELKPKEHVGIVPLTFIVPNYSKLKKSNAAWQSTPFYRLSHAHGYKLSFQVIPDGHKDAKGTHVSVFIYLMKEEFDKDLHWPLRGKMDILLVDHEVSHDEYQNPLFYPISALWISMKSLIRALPG